MTAQTKFIVWDWNGTLLDDVNAVLDCYNLVLARVGRGPMDVVSFREWHDLPFEKIYRRAGLTDDEIIQLKTLRENHIFHDNYEPMADLLDLRDGATDILSLLSASNAHSYILSNHIVEPIRKQLGRLRIEQHFREILAYASREDQFKHMTKGERLRHYMADNSLYAENALIIGDTIEEIEIAHELKLACVAITGGCVSEARLSAAKPDYLIHTLHELVPIMKERGFPS